MPSATQEELVFHASKKRRRDDDGSSGLDAGIQLYDALSYRKQSSFPPGGHASSRLQAPDHVPRLHHHYARTTDVAEALRSDQLVSNPLLARKVLPSIQPVKRFRLDDDDGPHSNGREQQLRVVSVPYSRQHSHNHLHQHPLKPPPTHDIRSSSTLNQDHATSVASRPQSFRVSSALAPCHVCARRPTKKSDLDSFADCEGCGMRTCYVCMRECLGWGDHEPAGDNDDSPRPSVASPMEGGDGETSMWLRGGAGHRQMVCSRCCVEQGADGDVICLGCLQRR